MTNEKRNETILIIGQMGGLAFRMDVPELEEFLKNPPADFRYADVCRAAIDFRKAVFPSFS